MVVVSRKLGRKYRTNLVLNPEPVVCESITLSARPQRPPNFNIVSTLTKIIDFDFLKFQLKEKYTQFHLTFKMKD